MLHNFILLFLLYIKLSECYLMANTWILQTQLTPIFWRLFYRNLMIKSKDCQRDRSS